ncbi:hypothetical protein Hypma_008231 [Hypsizygus marmoreus]|uniref:Uncharacterized protein n=1 Tax=Hypsizygus marmoreus TaxID=39966 RepID=A0A369JVM1_HYPMA|nr:hypothetical protein Hypma_008231 [Hypsizygus marmoreus]
MGELSLDKTFLLSVWVEVGHTRFKPSLDVDATQIFSRMRLGTWLRLFLLYFLCDALYSLLARHSTEAQARWHRMSSVMFIIATLHVAMNFYRAVGGYVDHRLTPGGPVYFMNDLRPWHRVLKDALFANQKNLGSAANIYRCWVIWKGNWKVNLLPCILLVVGIACASTISGYMAQAPTPNENVFGPRLVPLIEAFSTITVILNIMTTALISYRIWTTHRLSSAYISGNGRLLPILRIFVESAALQLIIETIFLSLYLAHMNAQYILLELMVTEWFYYGMKGITFNAVTLGINLHATTEAPESPHSRDPNQIQTIGSMPLRRIHINIHTDIETRSGPGENKPPHSPLSSRSEI